MTRVRSDNKGGGDLLRRRPVYMASKDFWGPAALPAPRRQLPAGAP